MLDPDGELRCGSPQSLSETTENSDLSCAEPKGAFRPASMALGPNRLPGSPFFELSGPTGSSQAIAASSTGHPSQPCLPSRPPVPASPHMTAIPAPQVPPSPSRTLSGPSWTWPLVSVTEGQIVLKRRNFLRSCVRNDVGPVAQGVRCEGRAGAPSEKAWMSGLRPGPCCDSVGRHIAECGDGVTPKAQSCPACRRQALRSLKPPVWTCKLPAEPPFVRPG
jgi:hypothetical protein